METEIDSRRRESPKRNEEAPTTGRTDIEKNLADNESEPQITKKVKRSSPSPAGKAEPTRDEGRSRRDDRERRSRERKSSKERRNSRSRRDSSRSPKRSKRSSRSPHKR